MLTGDKMETAKSIGRSTRLLDSDLGSVSSSQKLVTVKTVDDFKPEDFC